MKPLEQELFESLCAGLGQSSWSPSGAPRAAEFLWQQTFLPLSGAVWAAFDGALPELPAAFENLARTLAARTGREISVGAGEHSVAGDLSGIDGVWAELHSADGKIVSVGLSREFLESTKPVAPGVDLLMDVELPVSVSFGKAHVPLKEVLNLTNGSIIELSRAAAEPVDVVVNNCVIARGEVVVVEGNFGVRIQRVVSRKERLESLP